MLVFGVICNTATDKSYVFLQNSPRASLPSGGLFCSVLGLVPPHRLPTAPALSVEQQPLSPWVSIAWLPYNELLRAEPFLIHLGISCALHGVGKGRPVT